MTLRNRQMGFKRSLESGGQRDGPRFLLLLTATIDPKGMILTARQSPVERLKDYRASLHRWLKRKNLFARIVLCENSGYPIPKDLKGEFNRVGGDLLVIFQFDGNNYPRFRGKGYGEAKIIEYVVDNFQRIDDYDYVVKCTGRLYVPNISRILKTLDKGPDIACSLTKNLHIADSRLFAARPEVMKILIQGFAEEVNDTAGVYFEHVLARRIAELVSKGYRFSPWNELPYYMGVSGSTGRQLNSVRAWTRHLAKNLLYKISKMYAEI